MADSEERAFGMFITVLVTVCLNLAVPGTCMTERVVNSNQEDPTLGGRPGLLGFELAKGFWEHHRSITLQIQGRGLPVRQSRSARARQALASPAIRSRTRNGNSKIPARGTPIVSRARHPGGFIKVLGGRE